MMATPVRRGLAAGILALAFITGACGGDGGIGPSEADGTYLLEEVNGSGVPTTLTVQYDSITFDVTVHSGRIVLERGDYDGRLVVETFMGVDTIFDSGTFAVTGQTVTFNSSDPDVANFTAILNGNTLTQDASYPDLGDVHAVYRR